MSGFVRVSKKIIRKCSINTLISNNLYKGGIPGNYLDVIVGIKVGIRVYIKRNLLFCLDCIDKFTVSYTNFQEGRFLPNVFLKNMIHIKSYTSLFGISLSVSNRL